MKKINYLLMALGGALILSLSACDECADVTCENGGTCEEGDCNCPDNYYGESCEDHCVNGTYSSGTCDCAAGYEGNACTTESRQQFLGTYSTSGTIVCDQTGSSSVSNIVVTFNESSVSVDRMLVNLSGLSLTAEVDGSTFTFVEATIDGFTYTGNGSINGTTVSMTLVEYDPSVPEDCVYSLSGSRQ